MKLLFLDTAASAALLMVIKASALLCIAWLVQIVLGRRASAATRHSVWTLAVMSVLLLPAVSLVLPAWPLVVRSAPAPAPDVPIITSVDRSFTPSTVAPTADTGASALAASQPEASPLALWTVLQGVYIAGVVVMLLHVLLQRWQVRRLDRQSTVVDTADWIDLLVDSAATMGVSRPVRLLRSRQSTVPITFGSRRPSIVIPAIADTWDENRRRAVMLHELAHVARRDCLSQNLAVGACVLYWFHPAAWWIARQLRVERELACDDRVIAAGTEPREYAGHLLEIAYSFGRHRAPALAVCMARPRQLEGRLLAALDGARNRRVPALRASLVSVGLAIVVLAVIAGAKLTVAAAAPPDQSEPLSQAQRDRGNDLKTLKSNVKTTAKDLKEIANLPRLGLKEVRAGVSRVAAMVGLNQEALPGTWEIRPTDTKGTVHLRIVEVNSSSGNNVPIEQLEGLTSAQLTGAGGPVQFRVRRDAGTFTFEGVMRNGVGAGTFTFAADPNFPAEMAKRGYARTTEREQYQLARHDVGYAFIDELTRQGYAKGQTSDLVRAGQHGVNTTYLRDMGALGYRLGSLDPLITLRDHGVTPSYVRELADQGYKGLAADDLRQARDHGVTPDYVRGMRDGGYGSLPMNELIKVRDHGVTPDFVREIGDAGYRKLPLDQLLRVRDHGVTPQYVRDLRQLGFSLAIDDIVETRDHGVTIDFVREMKALGYDGQPMTSLIRVRDHGVTAEYARGIKALGYDKLSIDDLVSLRDHGMSVDRIRRANERAGTRLPIDMLRSLASGGMR